jgi:dTMP kinase
MMDVLRSIKKYYKPGKYDTIIMVRYLVGTAYLPKKLVKVGYNFFKKFVPTSDYMFFLDTTPEVLLKRIEIRSKREIFETYEGFVNVRNKALIIVQNWHIIDASKPIEEVFSKINKILDSMDSKKN